MEVYSRTSLPPFVSKGHVAAKSAEIERRIVGGSSSTARPPAGSIGMMMLTVAIGCCMIHGPALPPSSELQEPWSLSQPSSRLAQALQGQVGKRGDLWSLRFRELKRRCRAKGLLEDGRLYRKWELIDLLKLHVHSNSTSNVGPAVEQTLPLPAAKQQPASSSSSYAMPNSPSPYRTDFAAKPQPALSSSSSSSAEHTAPQFTLNSSGSSSSDRLGFRALASKQIEEEYTFAAGAQFELDGAAADDKDITYHIVQGLELLHIGGPDAPVTGRARAPALLPDGPQWQYGNHTMAAEALGVDRVNGLAASMEEGSTILTIMALVDNSTRPSYQKLFDGFRLMLTAAMLVPGAPKALRQTAPALVYPGGEAVDTGRHAAHVPMVEEEPAVLVLGTVDNAPASPPCRETNVAEDLPVSGSTRKHISPPEGSPIQPGQHGSGIRRIVRSRQDVDAHAYHDDDVEIEELKGADDYFTETSVAVETPKGADDYPTKTLVGVETPDGAGSGPTKKLAFSPGPAEAARIRQAKAAETKLIICKEMTEILKASPHPMTRAEVLASVSVSGHRNMKKMIWKELGQSSINAKMVF